VGDHKLRAEGKKRKEKGSTERQRVKKGGVGGGGHWSGEGIVSEAKEDRMFVMRKKDEDGWERLDRDREADRTEEIE